MKIGFLGLGKMGKRIVGKLLQDGHEVVVWNRSKDVVLELLKKHNRQVILGKLGDAQKITDFTKLLPDQKIFWVMLPAGDATESVLGQLDSLAAKGDIVIDGGNSYYKNTEKWYQHFSKKGVGFLGIGVSGGVLAAENGFPLMIGGDESSYKKIKPILETLSKPHGGFNYFGTGGAGHFVKMVHNGIEYGMMQSIGEGFGVLEKNSYNLDLAKVAEIWTKGTIISGFLMDRTKNALQKDPHLANIVGEIDATGEAEWTIQEAEKKRLPVQVIKDAFHFRQKSQKDKKIQKSFTARMVAALRHEFGGHTIKKK